MLISICIPTYEMEPFGADFLNFSLSKINEQTYKNIEVVISDHSNSTKIYDVVKLWSEFLNVKYVKTEDKIGNSSYNLNSSIKNASGEYIKILFQDDFLYDRNAIQHTVDSIIKNPNCSWFASISEHSHDGINFERMFTPRWNNNVILGVNTISSPSVITIKNDMQKLLFDEDLIWLMDCDYYHRCYKKFGLFSLINHITVVNRLWENQLTNKIQDNIKLNEINKIKNKHNINEN